MKGTITGRLGRDPELRAGNNGDFVTLSIAENLYNSKTKEREGVWYNCIAFGKTAELIHDNFHKGSFIIAQVETQVPYVGNNGNVQLSARIYSFDFPPRSSSQDAVDDVVMGPDDSLDDPFA